MTLGPAELLADLRTAVFEGAVLVVIVALVEMVIFPLVG